jgi:hypothetical protein
MWESYTASGGNYLAVVEGFKASRAVLSIFKWQDNTLTGPIQVESGQDTIKTPNHLETFTFNNQVYVVISQLGMGHDTLVYKAGADGTLTLYQGAGVTPTHTINSAGYTQNALVFTMEDEYYLALGYASTQSNVVPEIYRWQPSSTCGGCYLFIPIENQQLPASFARVQNWAYYQVNGKDFLATALGTGGARAYRWNHNLDELETAFSYDVWASDNVVGVTAFTINGAQHLVLAKNKDSTGNARTTSPILRWDVKK